MKFTALMLMVYMALVKVAVGSLVVGFAGSASTIAYFLLRKDVDGTDINDVYIEEQEQEEGAREEVEGESKAEAEKIEATATEEEQTIQEEEAKETPSEDPDTSSSEESDLKE
jgi:cobalamin biosynthesis protein CobT